MFFITLPLHVSKLLCYIQGARSQYLLSYIIIWMQYHQCITNTAFIYVRKLARTDYELPEDDAIATKHVGAV